MKKKFKLIGIIAIVAVIGFSIMACGGKGKSIDDLITHFKNSGMTVSEKREVSFKMVNAIDGCRIDLDGAPFELYKFDSTKEPGITILQTAKNDGIFSAGGFNASCFSNGSFIIVPTPMRVPKATEEKMAAIFKEFQE